MGDAVVVTGATGFLGRHLAERLLADGADVHAVVRAGGPRTGAVPEGAVVAHDLGRAPDLRTALQAVAPAACFHLATCFVAEHRTDDVDALVEANVAFGARMAEALAGPDAPVFVNVGTAWQHAGGAAYRPTSLYAATKQAFQDLLRYYADAGLLRVVNLKLFDTYGTRDERPKLVNLLMQAALGDRRLALSPGDQLIDLLHVDDVVEALLAARAAAATATPGTTLDFAAGSGQPRSLREVAALVGAAAGRPPAVEFGARPYRAVEMFEPWPAGDPPPGWEPRVTLEEGLARLVQERAAP